ncbi:MAG TPA: exodeoxyribonuclease VII large subunit [Acidimicrobiales bacterium]|nr:exodeoxyribonuclease VII large subunit [Acidimicrobiales bacterium]
MSLFDEPEAAGPRRVSLVRLAAEIARAGAAIGRIAVEGEVHNPKKYPSGRTYFSLRDRAAQISVAVPGGRPCRAVNGERVQVTGSLNWQNERGALELLAVEVVPVGEGAVAAMIAEVRARLDAEGILGRPRRPLPALPRRIAVICGSEAAVRGDIESVVAVRFPGYPVTFREVTVSGPGAAESMAAALTDLDARDDVDVVILARGGGDATQLLPFSDEALCRAIAAASCFVVSAVGHENDRPLCDEVADLRCGTPSIAAAAVVPDQRTLVTELDRRLDLARDLLARRVESAGRRLVALDAATSLQRRLAASASLLERAAGRLDLLHPGGRLTRAEAQLTHLDWHGPVRRRAAAAELALVGAGRQLEALSPVRVLERGYAVVRDASGAVVRAAEQVATGVTVDVELARGALTARVEEVRA